MVIANSYYISYSKMKRNYINMINYNPPIIKRDFARVR